MIPISVDDFDERVFNFDSVSFTYGIKYEQNKIKEYIDGLNAVKQAIYKILMTERGVFEIYDSEFGIALSDSEKVFLMPGVNFPQELKTLFYMMTE